jgi:hypothetical protein
MWARTTLLWYFLVSTFAVCIAGRATAEMIAALFPDGVPGYDEAPGVTVASRLHPGMEALGIREGAFKVMPELEQSAGYSSNALPGSNRRGSLEVLTAPSLAIRSDWSQDAFGAAFSIRDTRFLSLPGQDRVDGAASIGGRLDVGGDQLTLGLGHTSQHEDRGQINTIPSDRPVAFQIDDLRVSYAMTAGRWSIVPSLEAAQRTYGNTTILGVPASQSYRDRLVAQAGVTLHYELAPLRDLLFVVRAIGQDYTHTPAGQPSPNSISYQMLAGLDYDDNSVWRWRLLIGGEARHFANASYAPQNSLIAEAGVGWSPSGLTNISATISRDTEDAAREGVSGLIYSSARLTIDHEYFRDLIFKASVALQQVDFFQGGHQSGTTAGAGVIWMLNRSARLAFTYDQTDLQSGTTPAGVSSAGFSRGVAMVTLHLNL